jgi:hypothetical protein
MEKIPHSGLAAAFTPAGQVQCQRASCGKIIPLEQAVIIENVDPHGPSRHCCKSCAEYYQTKAGTVSRGKL